MNSKEAWGVPRARIDRVYWDACIFIAMLKGETHHGDNVTQHIQRMYQECASGDLEIVTSSLWRLEVNPDKHPELLTALEYEFDFGYFSSVAATDEVFSKVLEIRRNLGKKHLKLADAIHVATACVSRCPVLYSLDDGILNCAGKIKGLIIAKPKLQDAPLFD